MPLKPLHQIRRRSPEVFAKNLLAESASHSADAGRALLQEAGEYGIGVRDFISLAVDPRLSEEAAKFSDANGQFAGGYEAALAVLNLPVRDSFQDGIVLDLASDTFQTFPGTRALFPEVIDDLVRWKYRQDNFENTAAIVANSRTINGNEMISTVVDDKASDYQVATPVAEMSRVRVKSIRTTQNSVAMYKHGWGLRTSYEFQRRARLDMLTPYVNRANRELEMSKVGQATSLLINGDGVQAAAGVVTQSSYNTRAGVTATNGVLNYRSLMVWLIDRAKAGVPVDTVLGNWDSYIAWLMMFAIPTSANQRTDAENLAATGFKVGGVPLINGVVNFALSSTVPDAQLVGFTKGETCEELVEANSNISETERAILNQSITYVKTENTGYRLPFGDTRSVFNYGG